MFSKYENIDNNHMKYVDQDADFMNQSHLGIDSDMINEYMTNSQKDKFTSKDE